MTKSQVLDRYFLEHRAKLIDLAAFLDRVDRAPGGDNFHDPRLPALREALALLHDGQPDRARRVLERFSDPTEAPLDTAPPAPVLGVPHHPPPAAGP